MKNRSVNIYYVSLKILRKNRLPLIVLSIFALTLGMVYAGNISLGSITYDGTNLKVQHTADSAGTYEFEFCLSPGGCTYPQVTFTGPGTDTLAWGGYSPIQPNTTYTVRAHSLPDGPWSNSVSCTTNAEANACTDAPPPPPPTPVISLGSITYDGANLIVQHTADSAGTYEFEFCLSPGGCSTPTITFTGPGTDTLPWGGFSPIQPNTTYAVRARFQAGGAWSNTVSCTTNAEANACSDAPLPTPVITLGSITYDGANLIVQHTADSTGTYEFEFCLSPGGCSTPTITFTGPGTDTLPWGGFSPIQPNTTYTVRARYQAGGAWSNSVSCTTNAEANACGTPSPTSVPPTDPPTPPVTDTPAPTSPAPVTPIPATAAPPTRLPTISLSFISYNGRNLIVRHTADSAGTYQFQFCLSPGGCDGGTITFTGPGTDTVQWGGFSPIRPNTTYTVRARYRDGGAWSNAVSCTTNALANACTDIPSTQVPPANNPTPTSPFVIVPRCSETFPYGSFSEPQPSRRLQYVIRDRSSTDAYHSQIATLDDLAYGMFATFPFLPGLRALGYHYAADAYAYYLDDMPGFTFSGALVTSNNYARRQMPTQLTIDLIAPQLLHSTIAQQLEDDIQRTGIQAIQANRPISYDGSILNTRGYNSGYGDGWYFSGDYPTVYDFNIEKTVNTFYWTYRLTAFPCFDFVTQSYRAKTFIRFYVIDAYVWDVNADDLCFGMLCLNFRQLVRLHNVGLARQYIHYGSYDAIYVRDVPIR